jgi:hypothetical protein
VIVRLAESPRGKKVEEEVWPGDRLDFRVRALGHCHKFREAVQKTISGRRRILLENQRVCDAWGPVAQTSRDPVHHHLPGDSHLSLKLRQGPLRQLGSFLRSIVWERPPFSKQACDLTKFREMPSGLLSSLACVDEVLQDQFLLEHGEFGFSEVQLVAQLLRHLVALVLPTSNRVWSSSVWGFRRTGFPGGNEALKLAFANGS